MFLILLTSTILSFLLWIYVCWCKVKRYWADRGFPYVPPNPLLGNLPFLQRYNSGTWMRKLYDNKNLPYAGIWLFWRPAVIVNCPKIARRVLIKDASVFKDRLVSTGSYDLIGKYNLFSAKDPLWSSLRRRLTIIFTTSRLRHMHGLIQMKTKELLQRIDIEMKYNKSIDLRMVLSDYTTDVVGTAFLGMAGDATLTGKSVLRTVTKDCIKFSLLRRICWVFMFIYPELLNYFKLNAFTKKSTDYLRKVFRTVVAQRGGYENEITETRDLLDVLIKIKQDCNEYNEEMPEDILIAQATVFLLGGFDTTANTLSRCILELALHPEIQENLYKEILDVQRNSGSEEIEVENICNLKYLNSVIEETLRKYAPLGLIDRVASQNYSIDDNLVIPAGTPVYVNIVGINHDTEIFPEPTKFKPERFLNTDSEIKKCLTSWSFGEGPRSCIGRRFAMINLRYALARIILSYECKSTHRTPDPSKVETKRSLLYAPREKLYVKLIRRNEL